MQRRLPSLNALRCFEVVAAHTSVKKAAQILNVSESAVSRQVRILEEQLGLTLFLRTHSGLEITEAGRKLATTVKEAFDHIANALDPTHTDQDIVTLRVIPTFALRWLFPRLRRFHEQYPMIKVVVRTRLNDMTADETDSDLGIRYALGNFSHEDATELYAEWIVPVCAPGHIDVTDPERALRQATLLHPLPDHQDWITWSEKTGIELYTRGGLDFDALDMALSAAEAGLGVAIADVVLADQAIQDGRVIVPLRKAVPTGVSYYLVRRPALRHRRQVKLVEDWIVSELVESKAIIASYA
ncbi:LysR substrate-binding domain-containing protein [Achromobacter seleniivolatilans]|uniref:LysR substrate-binding domain-containing protein n=1 Tax=Achromobacter seleniivolatilans TaxID=3047478 RepID=A0ABY9LW87_9BURK|nr:LysR substrate-binding domain-containing protein [Achromobacter sp. R39]WMD18935.1 LysR substrate-binding domain-containing protein [Achromobacter sp. R39]